MWILGVLQTPIDYGGDSMKQFDITYFCGPNSECIVKEEVVADIAAAGITLCQIGYDTETNKQAIRLLKKYGLRASVVEKMLTEAARNGQMETIDEVIRTIVDDYKEFDNIEGWDIWDEPNTENFPMIAKIVEAFRRYAPGHETVINLFPDYAPVEALKDTDYASHLKHFVETVHPDFISYDHYPFMGRKLPGTMEETDEVEDEKERMIRLAAKREYYRGDFFGNLRSVRKIGLKNQIEQMMIALLTEHGGYRNLTLPEIRWQVNMCLAYGFHRVSYFTYGLPAVDMDFWKWDNAMINWTGEKYQHYYDVQTVNREIYDIGKLLFAGKSDAVFHILTGEAAGTPFTGYGAIKEVDGEQGVIGFFDNGYVYLVNYNYLEERTFTITSEKVLFGYEDGKFISLGSVCTVTLPAGGAKLFHMLSVCVGGTV